jgi:hypothetical protein
MKRVHNRSPSPSAGAKAQGRSKKRKNDSKIGPSKKSIATAEQPAAPAHSSSLDEEFQQQQQQLLSLLQDKAGIDTIAAIQIMAKTAQQLKSSVPKMERTNSQQSSG